MDSISSTLRELEEAGYVSRKRRRNAKGQLTDTEYIIYQIPHPKSSENNADENKPKRENPDQAENHDKMESLVTERVGKLNERKKQLKEVTDQIGKPFAKEAEFQAKTARLAVLNAELDTEGKKNEQGGITQDETPPVQGNGVKR